MDVMVSNGKGVAQADNDEEKLPVVDALGHIIGCASRGMCHNGSKLLHPVVHLHVKDSAGRLCMQLRPEWKTIQPGKWDTAVGGHVGYGEEIDAALRREVEEELGLSLASLETKALPPYLFESEIERELVYPFILSLPDGFALSPSDEVAAVKFLTRAELAEMSAKGMLTPNFEREYQLLVRQELATYFRR